MGTQEGLKCVCIMVRLGWPCGLPMMAAYGPVGRLGSSLAVTRGLCQPCTRGFRGTAPSRLLGLITVPGQAPASLCICTPIPRGLRRSRVLPSSFQPPSLAFPSFVPPPAGSRGFPHWSCLGQNQHCFNDNAPKPAGCGPCPFGRLSPDPSSSGSQQQPGAHVAAARE